MISEEPENSELSICVLSSGSKGNSAYISNGKTSLLVDAGHSGIEIERRMESQNLSPESLKGIVVTHEHSDHICGVGVLSRRYDIPVFMNKKTYNTVSKKLGKIEKLRYFESGTPFFVNSLEIHPFSISHDATDPSGFTFKYNNKKIGIATDLGIVTSVVKNHLKDCSAILIEANHDPEMLISGPYPWHLKQRIKSRSGHLSNEDARNLIVDIKQNSLSHIILGHLSEENNSPEKAFNLVARAINNDNIQLDVASQYKAGDLLSF